jgi:hypothetical protein
VAIEKWLVHRHMFHIRPIAAELVEQAFHRLLIDIGFGVRSTAVRADQKAGTDRERNVAPLEVRERLPQIALSACYNFGRM